MTFKRTRYVQIGRVCFRKVKSSRQIETGTEREKETETERKKEIERERERKIYIERERLGTKPNSCHTKKTKETKLIPKPKNYRCLFFTKAKSYVDSSYRLFVFLGIL